MPTALVVEDEPEANKLLGMLLKLKGYQSVPAFTGAEAFQRLREQVPDIVFLDLMLPDVNGYEICRALKGSKDTCLIPVVVLTARIAAENRIESHQAGADCFIPKPYLPDQIFLALQFAERLKQELAADRIEGSTPLSGGDDGEVLRELAHLRNLIFGRAPLSARDVDRVARLLCEVHSMAVRWSEANSGESTATLRYALEPDRLVLTFHDHLGWLDESTPTANHSFTGALERFDEVVVDRGKAFMSLTKKWE